MKIKRFFAENIRQAMQMVREELGADAVIMSNRKVDGGVEIVAARDFDEQSVRANTSSKSEDMQPDYFKPTKSEKQIKKVDLPDFQAEKNRLHVISSPRKQDDKTFGSSTARRGIDQYVGYAEKVQLRGNPDAVKHHFKTPAPAVKPSVPSIMIKVPQKKAKPQSAPQREPIHREQMPQREIMYRDELPQRELVPQREMYREPIMPQARDTQSEVRTEARDLRQYFREDYHDEFEEFLQEEGIIDDVYAPDTMQPSRIEPVLHDKIETPKAEPELHKTTAGEEKDQLTTGANKKNYSPLSLQMAFLSCHLVEQKFHD